MKNIFKKFISRKVVRLIRNEAPRGFHAAKSYAQQGEDCIIEHLLNWMLGEGCRTYLDIGANHPFALSNTALLYQKGGRGILVEPDPTMASLLRRKRGRDKIVQCGVAISDDREADFYLMDPSTLNTFSRDEAMRYEKMGHKLIAVVRVPLCSPNMLLEELGKIDFLNVDVEGFDLEVLKRIDFKRYRPVCICVESCSYEENQLPEKQIDIIEYLKALEYRVYADTYVNTIFVAEEVWRERFKS